MWATIVRLWTRFRDWVEWRRVRKGNAVFSTRSRMEQLTRTTRYSPEKVQAWKSGRPGFYAGAFGRRKAG
jgi:hypothetical protein